MEPMALGSPAGSPVQTPGSPTVNSAYLPGFLLGENHTPARLGVISPQDNSRYLNASNTTISSPIAHYGTPDYRINRQKAIFGNATSPNNPQVGTENHTTGPPTRGLFDSLETSQTYSTYTPNNNQNIPMSPVANQNRMINSPNLTSSNLFLENSINLNTTESQGLLQWVTVFGFLPQALDAVLSHISSRVRIVDKHSGPTAQSNWIHLKCATEQEAQRALACNGSIVSGTTMIGVIPCTDEGVILGCVNDNRSKLNNSMRFSVPGKLNHLNIDNTTPKSPRIPGARPLAAGYNQHLNPQSVRSPENIPQKSTGLVSKAMEYVFGW